MNANLRLVVVMAVLVSVVGFAGFFGGKKQAEAESGALSVSVSENPVENQQKILEELRTIKQNQAKMMADLGFIRSKQR